MQRETTIVHYTAKELEEMRLRGEDLTDVEAVKALTEEELEASVDYEDEGEFDWSTVSIELPKPKVSFTMRYDQDVLDWFRRQGPGYQTRINAVLKSYVDAQMK